MRTNKALSTFFVFTFIFMSILQPSFITASENFVAVTMTSDGDRFGDRISNYLQAQWIAHVTGFTFLYKPFQYSDQLMLHYHDTILSQKISQSFETHKKIMSSNYPKKPRCVPTRQTLENLSKKDHKVSTLYTLEFCSFGYDYDYRSNPSFIQKMRNLISPCESLELIKIPDNVISVALHLRVGIGYDTDALQKKLFQTRFLLPTFYAKAINDVMKLVQARPLYIYVFTDHPFPEKPIYAIQQLLFAMQPDDAAQKDTQNISWQWRTEDNRHDKNILIDFFSLLNFDCLIRPWSAFSGCAEILGEHALIIDTFRKSSVGPVLYRVRPNMQSKRYTKLNMSNGQPREICCSPQEISYFSGKQIKNNKIIRRRRRAK